MASPGAPGLAGSAWMDRQTGMRLQLATDKDQVSAHDILNVPVIAGPRQVRLGDVAMLRRTLLPVEIDHFNLHPVCRAQFIIERGQRDAAISNLTVVADKLAHADEPRIEIVPP